MKRFSTIKPIFLVLVLIVSTLLLPATNAALGVPPPSPSFDAIYQFGDSIADTGNLIRESARGALRGCGRPPYGRTFFGHPTGRCSDGRLIIDFIAQSFGLPLLNPYLETSADFSHGVNFAVAGATALDTSTLAERNIHVTATQSSLLRQLEWFKSHLDKICANPSECKLKLEKALFLVGEIGGNDYNGGAFQGRTMPELYSLVPDVVQTISKAVEDVIALGAKHIIVPGNFPVGCMTIYLSTFKSNDPTDYDEVGCLKNWNELAAFHNNHLQQAVKTLQQKHRHVNIVYADYYNALRSVLKEAPTQGFDGKNIHKACCGVGDNTYNYNAAQTCGSSMLARSCANPTVRLSWDGIHLTEHAYHLMADWLLKRIVPSLG